MENKKYNVEKMFEELKNDYVVIREEDKNYIHVFGPIDFPVFISESEIAKFNWYVWYESEKKLDFNSLVKHLRENGACENYNSIFTYGEFETANNPLVRVHSCCFTGDVMHSSRCECGAQLNAAIKQIVENKSGAIVYLANHEGRGIGLYAKAITHKIQDLFKLDTYESCNVINFGDDERKFKDAASVIMHLRNSKGIDLLSNNPEKVNDLINGGLKINNIKPLDGFQNENNEKYLVQKKRRAESIKILL